MKRLKNLLHFHSCAEGPRNPLLFNNICASLRTFFSIADFQYLHSFSVHQKNFKITIKYKEWLHKVPPATDTVQRVMRLSHLFPDGPGSPEVP
jgi:hypothetical protein